MKYETYKKGNYQVVKINEVIGLTSSINELADIVDEFLRKNIIDIALYFKDGSYLNSAAASVIVRYLVSIKDKNGNLAFLNISQDMLDLLDLINLDSTIRIYNSEEEIESS